MLSTGRLVRHDACEACGSSDNVGVYEHENGRLSGHCFGCQKNYYNYGGTDVVKQDILEGFDEVDTETKTDSGQFLNFPFGTDQYRRVTKEVAEHFGVRYETLSDGTRGDIMYPYYNVQGDVSWKVRKKPKDFRVVGGLTGVKLFGQDLFSGGRQVVVVEGEEDALAVAQAMHSHYNGKIYPVVALPSAGNLKPVMENLKWFEGFTDIILWMDNDDAGEKAKQSLAKMLGYAKCKIVDSTAKDASEILQSGDNKGVMVQIWEATRYNPRGILGKSEILKQMEEYSKIVSHPYPAAFSGLNDKLKGMRQGEITLFTSGTGAGKSSLMREVIWELVANTDEKIGIISLEESPAETAKKLCCIAMDLNPGEVETLDPRVSEGFEKVFGDDRILMLDHQGAITESISSQMNYMASAGCKYIFVDHITILVSEGADGLTGNEATDKVMNDLLKVAKVHNVWIGLVSHLRKSGTTGKSFEQGNMPSLDDIRGSGSIKQISMDIIAFSRNSEEGDNNVALRVLKCRHTGLTGDAGALEYNVNTGRLDKSDVEQTAGF